MNIKGKKVAVTGADGFIGSHLVEELVKAGAKVRAMSYYNSFGKWGWMDTIDPKVMKEVEVISGDIRDSYGTREFVKGNEVVLHLAALIAIPYSYLNPESYIDTNIKGTLNILNACRDFNVEKVVHTSTSEVYGTARFVPITEEHPLQGQSPYSASKIGADQLAFSFYSSFNTPVSIVRPFNTFGPRQSARAVIPTIISQLANGVQELKLGSIHPTRDFTYVKDTAKGFIAIAESEKTTGLVTNIGSGFEISIKDTVELIIKKMNAKASIVEDKDRLRPANSEVERLWASVDKAKERITWNPQFSGRDGFEKGIEQTIEWFLNPENLKNYKHHIYNV